MKKFVFMLSCIWTMLCTTLPAFAADGSSGGGPSIGGIVVGVIIGIIIAVFVMLGHKSKLKSVHMQGAAADYLKRDSFQLTTSREIYLYKKVDRRAKPKDNK